jgi:hypothetical protein
LSASKIAAYVAAIDDAKESVRQFAQARANAISLTVDSDPRDIADQAGEAVMNFVDDTLLAHLRDATVAYLTQTGHAAPADASVQEEIDGRTADAGMKLVHDLEDWAARLNDSIDSMHEAGISLETLAVTIAPGGAFTKSFAAELFTILSDDGQGIVDEISAAIQDAYFVANVTPEESLTWVAVQDSRECDGEIETACAPRHGKQRTLAQWEELGLPKSPHLNCSVWNPNRRPCRCVLVRQGHGTPTAVIVPRKK